jgi:hypothetical protein
MKKLTLFLILFLMGTSTFSFSPSNYSGPKTYIGPAKLKAMSVQDFLNLTPKKYYELTGTRMTLKQKLSFVILKAKLRKQLPDEKAEGKKTDIGLLSLVFGGGAFVLALIPYVGIISIPLALAAIVLGIIGLGRKKGDTKSLIGLVLGSLFIVLVIVVVAAFASGSWW